MEVGLQVLIKDRQKRMINAKGVQAKGDLEFHKAPPLQTGNSFNNQREHQIEKTHKTQIR